MGACIDVAMLYYSHTADHSHNETHALEAEQTMATLEEQFHFTPTVLQSAMGDPLRSEQRTGEILPRVLSRVDLLILFIAVVVFIPDAVVVQTTQTAGAITYL